MAIAELRPRRNGKRASAGIAKTFNVTGLGRGATSLVATRRR
jgi:hypothetical protein